MMEDLEVNKTSDEIINELFSSLNVPLSPKLVEVEKGVKREQGSAHTGDSDNSEDGGSYSKSSESDEEIKTAMSGLQEDNKTVKVEKQKTQKKKKDKKKKKKKHRKKEDGGRHKHKKKRKKENFETAEEAKLAADILQDIGVNNQAFIQKVINQNELTQETIYSKENETKTSKSESPKFQNTQDEVDCMNRSQPQESESYLRESLHGESESLQKEALVSSPPLQNVLKPHTSKCDENTSKSETVPCFTQDRSPEGEGVSHSAPTSPTLSGSHKRKQSPHSCSPSSVKKLKSTRSVSPSKSSSPKGVSRQNSPTCTERSQSRSIKDSKSESCRSHSRSPPVKQSKLQSTRSESKSKRSRSRSRKRSGSEKRSGSRESSSSKSKKKSQSKSKRRSRSKKRSRSRSRGNVRSRSRKRSRSRSGSRKVSKSKKKSRSRSKSRNRSGSQSRNTSGSKSRRKSTSESKRSRSRDSSRSRSRKVSDSKGRKSVSKSRSQSRQRSTSKSEKRVQSRYNRRSRSRSSKRSRSKSRSKRRSGSPSQRRSRSKSSHKSSPVKERFDMFVVMRERANRLAELKSQGVPDGSLGSLLLSAVASVPSGGVTGVPHSVPAADPKSIPLPQNSSQPVDTPAEDEVPEESSGDVEEEKPPPIVEDAVNSSFQEQDCTKSKEGTKVKQEEGNEKGKMKTIITIKSLKDSIVFQQAQEEAERKAKEKVDEPTGGKGNNSEVDVRRLQQQEDTDQQQQQDKIDKDRESFVKEKEKEVNAKKDKEKKEERKQSDGKQRKTSHIKEMLVEIEDNIMKEQVEKEGDEQKKKKSVEPIKEVHSEQTETKPATRNEPVAKTEVREESKENTHPSKIKEREERPENVQSMEVKENRKEINEVFNKGKSDENVELNKRERTDKEIELCKSDGVKKSGKNKPGKQVDEHECQVNPDCNEAEEEDRGNVLCSEVEKEENMKSKQPSEIEEMEEGEWNKELLTEEEKDSENVSCTRTEEKKDGKRCRQSCNTEDEEDSGISSKPERDENGHPQPEHDSTDKIEDGEIISDKEEVVTRPSSKSHSKKSKKDKSNAKEKKRSHKDKSKNKEEKKKAHSKKKEQVKARSRSKERHKSRQHSSSGSKERSHSRRYRKRSRSHSRSRDHSSRQHNRSHSRSRSKSRSKRRRESTSDLRDKVTRKRLLEIARRNAVYLMQNGCLPPSVEKEQLVKIKAGGKSVDELTDFCKQLVASGNYSDVEVSEPSTSSEEDNNSEKPFSSARHPFSVKDSKPILMNIRNAPMLPTKTNAERLAGQAKLREQFPVSSGSQHRTKESEWVPVTPKEKKEEDKVFTKPEAPPVDISQIVSTRLSAMRKLQDNPNDSEAIKTLNNVQKEMQNWALSKQEPGQFTGTTGVKVLSQEELSSGHQAWARKEQFKEAAPVRPHFGLKMLQKMGWSPGEGLGKNKEGTTEPLLLDVKMDKKGFHAQEEVTPKKQPIPLVKDLSGKHPVSALVELCSKRKWSPPDFEMVFDCGPDHKKNFLMKVMVNGQEFKPSVAASTKKMAKANAAAAYLQSLGLYPKDPRFPL